MNTYFIEDGFDETLIPVDFEKCGQIRDDYLYKTLVCPMKEGVTMTCIFDCCHSGTVLDLPYIFMADGHQDGMGLLESFNPDKVEQAAATPASDSDDEVEELIEAETFEEDEEEEVEEEVETVADTEAAVAPTPTPPQPPASPTKRPSAATDCPPEPEAAPTGEMQEVFVKFNSETIVINADSGDKFVEVKKELEKKTGVLIKDQHIIYNGLNIKFADHRSLKYYGCQGGCFMTMTDKSKVKA